MATRMGNDRASSANRWGIVLSGGNGTRLQDWVYRRRADYLPKQYVNFVGKRSMLEHTLHRGEKLIPAAQLFTVIAKEHLRFNEVSRQIAPRPQESIIVQPENKDTVPGILLPLMHLHKRNPDAVVTILPADHFILEENRFMDHVERAFRIVETDNARMVILGTEPHEADPEYGYILYGGTSDKPNIEGGRTVEMFVEKPRSDAAKMMIARGALWNTFVLVAKCKTLLQAIKRVVPGLYGAFETIQEAIGTPDERRVTERVYQTLPSLSFSKGVLEVLPFEHRRALCVLPVRGVTWDDWGTADHLSNSLRDLAASKHVQRSQVAPIANQAGLSHSTVTASGVQEKQLSAVKVNG
jgi:mannose-1-phosphate guanylyltransferase